MKRGAGLFGLFYEYALLSGSQLILPAFAILLCYKFWDVDQQAEYAILISVSGFVCAFGDLAFGTLGLRVFKSKGRLEKLGYITVRAVLLFSFSLAAIFIGGINWIVCVVVWYSAAFSPVVLNFLAWNKLVNSVLFLARVCILFGCGLAYFLVVDLTVSEFIWSNFAAVFVCLVLSVVSGQMAKDFRFAAWWSGYKDSLISELKHDWSHLFLPPFVVGTTIGLPLILSLMGYSNNDVALIFLIERMASFSRAVPSFLLQRFNVEQLAISCALLSLVVGLSSCVGFLTSAIYFFIPGSGAVDGAIMAAVSLFSFCYAISFVGWFIVADRRVFGAKQLPVKAGVAAMVLVVVFVIRPDIYALIGILLAAELCFGIFPLLVRSEKAR